MLIFDRETMAILQCVIANTFALILFSSAIEKMQQFDNFIIAIISYRLFFPSLARFFGVLLLWIELALTLTLVTGFAIL